MRILLAVMTSVLFFTACEFQQDPMTGAPQGQPPAAQKPQPAKPLPKEAMQIDAPDKVNGRIDVKMNFKIQGRVMIPGVDSEIIIDNISDFPGASFDSQTGEFAWVPAREQLGSLPDIDLTLKVTLATVRTAQNPTISVEKKDITLHVENVYTKPAIVSISALASYVAGNDYEIQFALEDVDAIGNSDVSVEVRDCPIDYYYRSIGHLVKVNEIKIDTSSAGSYVGKAKLMLSNADIGTTGRFCFGLMAISKFGVKSDLNTQKFDVYPKLRETKMTLGSTIQLTQGETTQVNFAIYDPADVASLEVVSVDDIAKVLPGSLMSCRRVTGNASQIECSAWIETAKAYPNTYNINIKVKSSIPRSNQETIKDHTLRINVKAALP